jgi:hypothetical protein
LPPPCKAASYNRAVANAKRRIYFMSCEINICFAAEVGK